MLTDWQFATALLRQRPFATLNAINRRQRCISFIVFVVSIDALWWHCIISYFGCFFKFYHYLFWFCCFCFSLFLSVVFIYACFFPLSFCWLAVRNYCQYVWFCAPPIFWRFSVENWNVDFSHAFMTVPHSILLFFIIFIISYFFLMHACFFSYPIT